MNVFPVNHGIVIDFVSYQAANYPTIEKEKSINSRRLGVMLICALQTLSENEKLSFAYTYKQTSSISLSCGS